MASNSSDRYKQPQNIKVWMSQQTELQKFVPRIAELAVFQQVLNDAYPLYMLNALSLKEEVLTISAPSPTIAAKLRQSTPSLLIAIQAACDKSPFTSGRKVSRIRYKPQMGFSGNYPHSGRKALQTSKAIAHKKSLHPVRMPNASLGKAQQLMQQCQHEKLKFALTNLLNTHKKMGFK